MLPRTAPVTEPGFSTFDLEYFEGMWDILVPSGHMKLFISELEDEAVSAQFCIAYGDTVVAKQIGWSGHHGLLRPNEALDWATIRWAKANGYRYYDLEGIERTVAEALSRDEQLPESFRKSAPSYKFGFGGEVRLLPKTYCYALHPLMRLGYKVMMNSFVRNLLNGRTKESLRTRRFRLRRVAAHG